MIWDLIKLLLLILAVFLYSVSLYQNNAQIRHLEKKCAAKEGLIDAQRRLLEAYVEAKELAYREMYELMGDVLTLETERDYWKKRALSMQRELYHDGFFEEE